MTIILKARQKGATELKNSPTSLMMKMQTVKNIFAVLEGGYHDDIKECVDAFINGVNVGSRPIKDTYDHEMSLG